MPIPDLTDEGLLPFGIYECNLVELRCRFGAFQTTDRRPTLFDKLKAFVNELQCAGTGKYLIVNGSFVTDKHDPNDIDLLLVLKDDVNLTNPIPPFQYNSISNKYIKKKYPFDFFIGYEHDDSYFYAVELFHDVKYQPGKRKGILKILL